jgi:hypothetical protein
LALASTISYGTASGSSRMEEKNAVLQMLWLEEDAKVRKIVCV